MKKQMNIGIQEIFMAKAGKNGWDNCFHGTIERSTDDNGDPIVYGKIKVNDKIIQATGKDQWELGEKLDELVLVALNGDNLFENSNVDMSLN